MQRLVQTTVAHQASPAIRRVADPTRASDVAKVITSGTANYGVYIMQDGNETAAVKFSKEDTRRAVFADKVLGAAGIANTNATSQRDGSAIIANIKSIAHKYETTGTTPQKAIAVDIRAKIDSASKATNVLVMDKAEGADFHDVMEDANSDKSFLTSAAFHTQLGRLAAADALLGNSDRFAAVMQGKSEWAILNPANFKVTAQGVINTLDNDTQVAGVSLLRKVGSKTTPDDWAKFLIRGGKQHTTQYDKKNRPIGQEIHLGQRITPNLEALFDKSKRKLYFDALEEKAQQYNVAFTLDFDTFDRSFNAGIGHALTGMVQQLDTLRAAAEKVGGSDAGGGLIDPAAFEHKANYLKDRMAGSTAAEAEGMMVLRIQAQAVLHFKSEFRQVSKVPLEADKLTKFARALTPNSKIDKFAEELKNQARGPGAKAEDLKSGEEKLRAMIQGEKDPDRRVYKALFEAKFARLKLYLQETDAALDAMVRGGGATAKRAWLSQFQFRAKLENTYKSALAIWHTKLNAIGDADQSAVLTNLMQSLVDKAAAMEKSG